MSVLTQAGLEHLVPLHAKVAAGNKRTQRIFDGEGLLLNVEPDGRAEWVLRVMKRGQCFDLPLLNWPNCDLKGARRRARMTRDMVLAGQDLDGMEARSQTETKGAFLVVERLQPLEGIAPIVEAIEATPSFEQMAQEHRRVLATVLRGVAVMLDANSDAAIAPATPMMDVNEVATLLNCHPTSVEANTRTGRLPAVKFGRSWVYPRAALMEHLNKLATMHVKPHVTAPPHRLQVAVPAQSLPKVRGRPRKPLPFLPSLPDDKT